MNRGPGTVVAVKAGRIGGRILLGLLTVVLPLYFLATAAPGRAMVTLLAEEEVVGETVVGELQADLAGGGLVALDLAVRDRHQQVVVTAEALEVVARDLGQRAVRRLSLTGAKLNLELDKAGNLNLLSLMPPKKEGPPSPRPLALDQVEVVDSSISFVSPWGRARAEGIRLAGGMAKEAEGKPSGTGRLEVAALELEPADELSSLLQEEISWPPGPYGLGPLTAALRLDRGRVILEPGRIVLPGLELLLTADIDPDELVGQVGLTATRAGVEIASVLVSRAPEDWMASGFLSQLTLPGQGAWQGMELSGLSLNAVPEQLSVKLNRLSLSQLRAEGLSLDGLSISAHLDYEGVPLVELASGGGDLAERVADAVRRWRQGRVQLLVLADALARGPEHRLAPLRGNLEGGPQDERRLRLALDLALHPAGTLRAELVIDRSGRTGLPFSLTMRVEGLELLPLAELAGLPAMIKGMVDGRLQGVFTATGELLSGGPLTVTECTLKLVRKDGGALHLVVPQGQERWSLDEAPSFSLLARQLQFGEGRLLLKVAEGTRSR